MFYLDVKRSYYNTRRGIWYLFRWENNQYKFIRNHEAKDKWPRLIFNFYRNYVFSKNLGKNNVFLNLSIEIEQNAYFDLCFIKNGKSLIRHQSMFIPHSTNDEIEKVEDTDATNSVNGESVTTTSQNFSSLESLKTKNIPFGAKGRKRAHSVSSMPTSISMNDSTDESPVDALSPIPAKRSRRKSVHFSEPIALFYNNNDTENPSEPIVSTEVETQRAEVSENIGSGGSNDGNSVNLTGFEAETASGTTLTTLNSIGETNQVDSSSSTENSNGQSISPSIKET